MDKNNSLNRIRKSIDGIDDKILDLLSFRKDLIKKVAGYKKKNNISVYDPEREEKIFQRLIKRCLIYMQI